MPSLLSLVKFLTCNTSSPKLNQSVAENLLVFGLELSATGSGTFTKYISALILCGKDVIFIWIVKTKDLTSLLASACTGVGGVAVLGIPFMYHTECVFVVPGTSVW